RCRLGEFLGRSSTKLPEPTSRHEEAALEGTSSSIIGLDGLVQVSPDVVKVAGVDTNTFVQLLAQCADLLGVLRNLLLPPAVRHCPVQGDQRSRCSQNDPLFDAELDQSGIVLKGSTEERLTGQEEDDKLRGGIKLLPVALL